MYKDLSPMTFFVLVDLLHSYHMRRAILSLCLFVGSFVVGIPAHLTVPFHAPVAYAADSSLGKAACNFLTGADLTSCQDCFDGGGAWTAIGCIGAGSGDNASPKPLNDFLRSSLQIGIGAGGGIAFLLILFSGFQTIISAGNPEKLHEAKELMTAAITGLLLIIFSVFLLKIIGSDILAIPGWSGERVTP